MKTKQVPPAQAARKKRAAAELARGMRFWLNLHDSLAQSRTRGIPLEEAKGRLAERLAAESSAGPSKPRRRVSRRRRAAAR